ncbi:hypothetical protein [Streptomyces sp. NPDC056387]|uniref:hypothetical protein n=1 Tax=Streptomyces sp. NPDC056387 TaxID=3345803 RepID=UPI0035E2078B
MARRLRAPLAAALPGPLGKRAFPTAAVYGNTDHPELRVITCGGDLTDGHRPDDIIVCADPVGWSAAAAQ